MSNIDTRHNPANEFVKYKFLEELGNSQKKDILTVDQHMKAIHEFEVATGFRDFQDYDSEWAKIFKHHMQHKRNQRTGENISDSYYVHYLAHTLAFFKWLVANEPSYKKIKTRDVEFLKASQNEENQAKATNFQEAHNIADLLATARLMPEGDFIEQRNKAMFSLCILTSPRIGSLQTTRLRSVQYMKDYDAWALLQNPKTQKTKKRQPITSFLVGQSQDIIDNVLKWRNYLLEQGFAGDDFLFPRAERSFDKTGKSISVLSKKQMKSPDQVGKILKAAFAVNNLEYRSSHKFRHSIARKLKKGGATAEMMIALADNFGHSTGMATIISSYAGDYLQQQAKIMKSIELE